MGTLLDALTQENLDTQREVVKEEKRQRYDNVPYGDVMELLNELTFPPDHPYGHTTIGSMEDLDAATLEDVHAFFRRHYVPNNAVLSIVGDVEPDDAFQRADVYLGNSRAVPNRPNPRPGRLTDSLTTHALRPRAKYRPTLSTSLGGYPRVAAGILMHSISASASSGTARRRGCTNN